MANLRKFGLLLWKNYILQKRHNIQTGFEILIPVFLTGLLVIIRVIITSENIIVPTTFPSFKPGVLSDLKIEHNESDSNNCYITGSTNLTVYSFSELLYYPDNNYINDTMTKITEKYFTRLPNVRYPDPECAFDYTNTHLIPNLLTWDFVDYSIPYLLWDHVWCMIPVIFFFQGFPTEDAMLEYYNQNTLTALAGISFSNLDSDGKFSKDIQYSLRFPAKLRGGSTDDERNWYTEFIYPVFQLLGPRRVDELFGAVPHYYEQGFLYLQHAIDEFITRNIVEDGDNLEYEYITMQRFPYPPYIDDVFLVALQNFLPFIFLLSFIYPCINITKSIVHEKEKRLKESMKIMGLPNYLHWLAWFLKSFIFLLISTILMVILIKIKIFEGGELGIITYGNGIIIFIFVLSYTISVICISFLISTLFSTANSASIAAGVIFFISYLPYTFMQPRYSELSSGTILGVSILSNTAMAFGCQLIAMFEGTAAGVQWSTINAGASPDDTFTMLDCLIMLWVDSILYFVLAWYIEGVRPGDFGVPLPWYFPFTKTYWLGITDTSAMKIMVGTSNDNNNIDRTLFEAEPANTKAGIQIQNLTKIFNKRTAVNSMSLNMYDSQITALLGHNGAGKTTTMSMLTGLFPPTSGTALLNGFDIGQEMSSVRSSLGLCPQHDVLFDELTVTEHLQFFCQMKGMPKEDVQVEIDRLLKSLNLEPKRHAEAQTLSGGMKRKLCVAIAFCAGSRVVLLDEPTSGMDPGARRATWDLLQQEKKNRTLVLSTHFMEEADVLGDRIAIMAEGKVRCSGSSLFLKKRYGGGYHLTIVKEPNCSVENITTILQKTIPDVEVDQNVGAELSYSLPESKSHLFPDMFQELESQKHELGIASYGASITTMEEVFMKVGKEAEAHDHSDDPSKNTRINMETLQQNGGSNYKLYEKEKKNEGAVLLIQQLRAMFIKKMLYAFRNKLLIIFQTVIPIFILIITLAVVQTLPGAQDAPLLEINLNKYTIAKPITTMACNPRDTVCNKYETFLQQQSYNFEEIKGPNYTEFILEKTAADSGGFNYKYIVGMEKMEDSDNYDAYFNAQPYHGAPLSLNFLTNAILQKHDHDSATPPHTIKLRNHPLPLTDQDKADQAGGLGTAGFQVGFNMAFGLSFLASSFVVFLIQERESRAKHLQFVSGVKFPIFWAASFIFDAINYIVPCLGLMVVLLAFQTEDFFTAQVQLCIFVLFLLYGFAVIPQMYVFSYAFSIPSSGFVRMVMFNIFSGMATILAITILQIESLDVQDIADILDWVFMIFPQYNLGMGFIQMSTNSQLRKYCTVLAVESQCRNPGSPLYNDKSPCCTNFPRDYLDWKPVGIGRNLFFLALTGIVCIIGLFIAEAKVIEMIRFRRNKQVSVAPRTVSYGTFGMKYNCDDDADDVLEDSDVLAETARIRSTNLTQLFKTENLVLRDLTKTYETFTAVDKLCLGVQGGECFGLLGVNGAGKTTTFKMLTGDHPISAGDAYIYSTSVKSDIKEVQKNLGYCPQFDALIEELTGRETITLFARLRGVPENRINALVNTLAANLLFTEHIDKRCGAYSGGNKRKLSTAIALCGNPPLVFLDEPTTGMDPVARRHLWNAITKIRDAGTSIVLTSHSMEECEALCTRISIMVNGKFRCLGPPQHLKNKFGEGYTLIAQTSIKEEAPLTRASMELGRRRSSAHSNAQPWEKQLVPLKNYIERSFPGANLKDIHPGYLQYHIIATEQVTWADLFRKMEDAKSKFNLEAYSVGQTTLEQVFLNFTKAQLNSDD